MVCSERLLGSLRLFLSYRVEERFAALNVFSRRHAWHGKLVHAMSTYLLLIALQAVPIQREPPILAVGAYLPLQACLGTCLLYYISCQTLTVIAKAYHDRQNLE